MSVLRGRKARARWRRKDRLLAVALETYESNRPCGHPVTDWGSSRDIVVDEVTCPWCEAVEKHHQSKEPGPGVKVIPRDDAEEDDDR